MKMYEEINHFKREYVYERYTRIVAAFKDYDKITKVKMLDSIYDVYSDYNNIIDICTTRELKYLKMILDNKLTIDDFINKYQEKLSSFCNGLKKDIAAVKNAISNSINSRFVEGNNNKFKLIKRIVYGKQKLCNLFKRCWLNFTSTLDDLEILKLTIDPFVKMQKQDI